DVRPRLPTDVPRRRGPDRQRPRRTPSHRSRHRTERSSRRLAGLQGGGNGDVQVATTEVSDPAAFAKVQAGSLDPAGVRTEAYVRNNAGRFAESSEFF